MAHTKFQDHGMSGSKEVFQRCCHNMINFTQKTVQHTLVFGYILSCPEMAAFNVIYRSLEKSFCNNRMNSKFKFEVP